MTTALALLQEDVDRAYNRWSRTKSREDFRELADCRRELYRMHDILTRENPPQMTNKS